MTITSMECLLAVVSLNNECVHATTEGSSFQTVLNSIWCCVFVILAMFTNVVTYL